MATGSFCTKAVPAGGVWGLALLVSSKGGGSGQHVELLLMSHPDSASS